MQTRTIKRLLRLGILLIFDVATVGLLAALYCLRPVLRVKVLLLNEFRIGELIGSTDVYLRRLALGLMPKPTGLVFSIVGDPSNQQLIKMYRRKFPIIQSRLLYAFVKRPIMRNSPFVESLSPLTNNEFCEYNSTGPAVTFTDAEEKQGQLLLKELGIPKSAWYVCFHARDSAYLRQRIPDRNMSFTDIRNSSIENCYDAMKYVASQGGYAVRMGSAVDKQMPDLGNSRIIDYATKFRSDFGDIFLLGTCRFFLASGGGLTMVPYAFNVPVVNANEHAFGIAAPLGEKDLCLPKPVWSYSLGRSLSLPEFLGSHACFATNKNYFDEAGLEMGENSPEDVLAVTQEMLSRLDGSFLPEEDDDELQQKFRDLLTPRHVAFDMPGRIGAAYLRAHQDSLEKTD